MIVLNVRFMDDDFEVALKMFGIGILFFIIIIVVVFLTSSQTGNIAGYSITMPGIAWIGVPAFLVLVLILYVKNRM